MREPIPTADLVQVTPKVAAEWLEANRENRRIRPAKVATYANDIALDNWLITGEGVKFDWDGRLFDGQHRLLAIVRAGIPVWMFVFRNLPPDAQTVVDTGAKRSASDALKFAGHPADASNMAALARIVILWDEGLLRRSAAGGGGREVTNAEIVDWVDAFGGDAYEWLLAAARIDDKGKGFPTVSRATLGAALYIISRIDPDGVRQFSSRMLDIRLNGKGDPLNALHARMLSAKSSREYLRTAAQLFCYFRTWNALVSGERLTILKIGKTGHSAGVAGGADIMVPAPKRGNRVVA